MLFRINDANGIKTLVKELLLGLLPNSTTGFYSTSSQLFPGTIVYRNACLLLLTTYLEVSFDPADSEPFASDVFATIVVDDSNDVLPSAKPTGGAVHVESDDDEEEDEDYDTEDDNEDDYDSYDEEDDDDSNDKMHIIGGKKRFAERTRANIRYDINLAFWEQRGSFFRTLCPILTDQDSFTLETFWRCMNCFLKRFSPCLVIEGVKDLRDSLRASLYRSKSTRVSSTHLLTGFNDPKYPLEHLFKLCTDTMLHADKEEKLPALQTLSECTAYCSGLVLHRYVTKIVGPLIRMLGERQTKSVRVTIMQILLSLVEKCPQTSRPFVIQLQAIFLKCFGDSSSDVQTIGIQGLSEIVPLTPKLDPLLLDLTRIPVQTILAFWNKNVLPSRQSGEGGDAASVGVAVTAAARNGIATNPDLALQALQSCLIKSSGKASLESLRTIVDTLIPLMCMTEGQQHPARDSGLVDSMNPIDGSPYKEEMVGGSASSGIPAHINGTTLRVLASSCVGCAAVAVASCAGSKLSSEECVHASIELMESVLFLTSLDAAYDTWLYQQCKAITLLVALRHGPNVLLNQSTITSGAWSRFEQLLVQLSTCNTIAVTQVGLRCIGLVMSHVAQTIQLEYDPTLLVQTLVANLKHENVDIRLLTCLVANHVAWSTVQQHFHTSWFNLLVHALALDGSNEKQQSATVCQASDAVLSILFLRDRSTGGHASVDQVQSLVDTLNAETRTAIDPVLQRIRTQNWSAQWKLKRPDLDISSQLQHSSTSVVLTQ